MNLNSFLALEPLLVLTAGSVLLMLLIASARHHQATAQLTTLILLLALAACWHAPAASHITPLLTFDAYARTVQALMIFAGLMVTLLMYGYLEHATEPREEMYLLLVIAVLGASVLGGAQHAASLLLGLEIMTVALFAMIGYKRDQRAGLEAASKYLVLSAAASATLLFGLALIYSVSGTLSFNALSAALERIPENEQLIAQLGAAMLLVGLGFKLSLVPFHYWTPDVYQGAPAPITAFLATLTKASVAAVLLRFLGSHALPENLAAALSVLAILTILAGNLLALESTSVKRLLAYSSMAHVGYLLVPIILGGAMAREALLYYLVAYVVTSLGAFGVVSRLSSTGHGEADQFSHYRGLFWRRPYLTSVMTPMLLSLAGVPLTAGFIAKFYVLNVAVAQGAWALLAAVLIGSAIGLYYYLRLTILLFRSPASGRGALEAGPMSDAGISTGVALASLFVLMFWLGIWPQALLSWLAGT